MSQPSPSPSPATNLILSAAVSSLPLNQPILGGAGLPADPAQFGFMVVHTGGGCMALRKQIGDYYMLITSEDGCYLPDQDEWEENLIGVYRDSDDAEISIMTALQWKMSIQALAPSST